ncbi:hypothetical protein ENSA5_34550 [Enhygromyxa salina]|uniref:DUF4440 domain-containing protein n=1 Tax=Enhygromyxa salina TaxID=215803 RepID=A0A2S9XXE6_9BACT|nr:nuclear transport factor 2 family protein [Enhygromyxa salina]PRP97391.1 hypothetical protein ENSA5_34550 [Enhygromyxa salina]
MAEQLVEKLSDLNNRLRQATLASDPKAFGELLHDDWFTVDASGGITEKMAELKALATARIEVEYEFDNLKIQGYGHGIAVVTGTTVTKGAAMKKNVEGEYRFMQFWAHSSAVDAQGDNWLMLACINFMPQNLPNA